LEGLDRANHVESARQIGVFAQPNCCRFDGRTLGSGFTLPVAAAKTRPSVKCVVIPGLRSSTAYTEPGAIWSRASPLPNLTAYTMPIATNPCSMPNLSGGAKGGIE
jgi:hypothetical protein